MKDKVNVLGTEYKIKYCGVKEDELLEKCDGYIDWTVKKIVIKTEEEGELKDMKSYVKNVLRHEIVHAFLFESGLAESSCKYESGWATNEEMVDYIARQGIKICKAWEEAEAI
ncbi:MAG: hypothetical protein RSF40_02115 [Oscillospiraceae bacterium]